LSITVKHRDILPSIFALIFGGLTFCVKEKKGREVDLLGNKKAIKIGENANDNR
jgi:hypothetical protein